MWKVRIAGLELNPGVLNAKTLRYTSLTYRVICGDKHKFESGDDPWLMEKFPRDEHCL